MEWYIYGLISAALFSLYYVSLKKNLSHKHSMDYIFIYVTFLAVIALALYPKASFQLHWLSYVLLYANSWLLLGFFILLTEAYKHLEVSEIAPLSNLTTVLAALIGVFVFSESMSLKNFAGIVLVLSGAYILEVGIKLKKINTLVSHLRNRYIKLVLLSALFAAISVALDKIILVPSIIGFTIFPTDVFTAHFFTRVFCLGNMLLILLFRRNGVSGIIHGLKTSGIAIFLASIAYTVANLAYYKAMTLQNVSLVIPLLAFSSLITTIAAGEMFHEHKLRQKVIAAIIMIVGVYFTVT